MLPSMAISQSFTVKPRYYEGKYYMVAEDFKFVGKRYSYFALDMETARPTGDTALARQLFNLQAGTDLPMKNFISGNTKASQPYTELKCHDIKAFAEILDRDKDLLKKKKKEDIKNNIINQQYIPSELVIYNDASARYYLLSTYGIYYVHRDSVQTRARTAIEYTGFWFTRLLSAKFFNPNAFILEFAIGTKKKFFKTFNMQSGEFSNIPGLDEMVDIKYLLSRSSPYVIFYGASNKQEDVHQRTVLFNYETQKVEANLRFYTPDGQNTKMLYLHKNLLYCQFEYQLQGWQHGIRVIELKSNASEIFYFKQNL
jgi:hypothetical protein